MASKQQKRLSTRSSVLCIETHGFLRMGLYISPDYQKGPWRKKRLRTADVDGTRSVTVHVSWPQGKTWPK
jgi:hypothetical protein